MPYYKHMGNLVITEGVKSLADSAGCYWLLDIIASYQHITKKDNMLRDMQFWHLRPNKWEGDPKTLLQYLAPDESGGKFDAHVTCERDTDNVAIAQQIIYTDFPFKTAPEVKLYVQNNGSCMVVCLPEEY